jgi:transposase
MPRWGTTATGESAIFTAALGQYRWVVERTLSWLLGCRRLGVRYERRAELLQGLLHLACALLCLRFLGP